MFRRIRAGLISCLIISLSIDMNALNASNSASNLKDLHWQHRVIVAFVARDTDAYNKLVEWTDANRCQLYDRQVLVMRVDKHVNNELTDHDVLLDEASVLTLVRQRRSIDAPYEMLLIGKDGGVKAHSTSINELDAFIHQIDGMPMRRHEMKADKC